MNAVPQYQEGFSQLLEFGGDADMALFNSKNKRAFTKVYNQLYPSIYYFALRFVNEEDALDFTADAFYKLWKHKNPFPRLQSIKLFLQVAVRNECMDYLKHGKVVEKQKREFIYLVGDEGNGLNSQNEIEEELLIKEKYLKRIYSEMEKLPEQCKRVFKLAYLVGLKNGEIARRLRISEKLVSFQKIKAIRHLRVVIFKTSLLILLIVRHICLAWPFSQ